MTLKGLAKQVKLRDDRLAKLKLTDIENVLFTLVDALYFELISTHSKLEVRLEFEHKTPMLDAFFKGFENHAIKTKNNYKKKQTKKAVKK